MRDWRPVETAPKTGERVLLGHAASVWEDEWWRGNGSNGNWTECLDESVGYRGTHAGEMPTHWQPLPDPPTFADVSHGERLTSRELVPALDTLARMNGAKEIA